MANTDNTDIAANPNARMPSLSPGRKRPPAARGWGILACLALVTCIVIGSNAIDLQELLSSVRREMAREDVAPATATAIVVQNKSAAVRTAATLLPLGPDPFVPPTSTNNTTVDLCHNNNATSASGGDFDFRGKSGLFAIVTGIEHTGTTMTASLLQNAPNLYGAFECGLLAAPTPKEFIPCDDNKNGQRSSSSQNNNKTSGNCTKNVHPLFYDCTTLPPSHHCWALTPRQRDEMISKPACHAEQYGMLRRFSPYFKPGGINEGSWLVDKTPMYYKILHSVMKRTPGVPVVVTEQDDDAVRKSFQKRGAGRSVEERLEAYHRELKLCRRDFPDRLHVLNYTALTEDPHRIMTEMFAFLGLRYDPSYLTNEKFSAKGEPFGRPPSPAFNLTRLKCGKECVTTPYGPNKRNR